ncbi:MAG: extracellular solute-binding protein [Lachnospiraceae bacterium]|nr:extracellular solute-binding protein [Lachnospiraceae bacterium]
MRRKRVFGTLALVLGMTCLLVTGCGEKTKELELFSSKAENADSLQKLVDEFNTLHESEGVKVVLNTPADAGTILKTRLAKNDVPDIMSMGGDVNYTEVQSAGVLADLGQESYMSSIQASYQQMVYDVQKDKEEVAYGVPYATNASGVLYNVDKFEELGLEIPKTWDEFLSVIDTIEAAGEKPFEFTLKDKWTGLCPWNSMAPDLQPDGFTDARLANETTFADTHTEIAEKYLTLLDHAQADFMGTGYDDGNKAFANGEAVMMINGNWAISQFTNANTDFNVDMFAFPASNDPAKNYVTSGVDVLFCVNKDSKNLELAKEFVAFMMEPDHAKQYINEQFAFSAVEGVVQEDAKVDGVKEDIANGKVANFPDHYYPNGFDLAALLSQMSLNHTEGMDRGENIKQFLASCDEKYDISNVQ